MNLDETKVPKQTDLKTFPFTRPSQNVSNNDFA